MGAYRTVNTVFQEKGECWQSWMKLNISHIVVGIEFVRCLQLVPTAITCSIKLCPAPVECWEGEYAPVFHQLECFNPGLVLVMGYRSNPAQMVLSTTTVLKRGAWLNTLLSFHQAAFFDIVKQRSWLDLACPSLVSISQESMKSRIVNILTVFMAKGE